MRWPLGRGLRSSSSDTHPRTRTASRAMPNAAARATNAPASCGGAPTSTKATGGFASANARSTRSVFSRRSPVAGCSRYGSAFESTPGSRKNGSMPGGDHLRIDPVSPAEPGCGGPRPRGYGGCVTYRMPEQALEHDVLRHVFGGSATQIPSQPVCGRLGDVHERRRPTRARRSLSTSGPRRPRVLRPISPTHVAPRRSRPRAAPQRSPSPRHRPRIGALGEAMTE